MSAATISSTGAARYLQDLLETAQISPRRAERARKEFANTGQLVIRTDRISFTITVEALDCDCGKGILCPFNFQEVTA